MRDPPPLVLRARWAAPTPAPGPLGIVIAALIGGTAALGWSLAALTTAGMPMSTPAVVDRSAPPPAASAPADRNFAQDDPLDLP
jgi:hypothetical protein